MNDSNYYRSRINKAVEHIDKHLAEPLRIEELAKLANFSTFHFQRLYKALQGETPYETLFRLRLEKAVFLLSYRSKMKISEVAYECGFPSVENFSRQFKTRFQNSPSAFRKTKKNQNSRIYQGNNPQDFYNSNENSRKEPGRTFEVYIEELEAIPIAFIRALFGTDGSVLVKRYHELIDWAEKNDLPYQGELARFGMSIDNPEVTPANQYRYDFAIRVGKKIVAEGIIEKEEIPKGKYATIHCIGKLKDVAQAWDYMYQQWLPNSEYTPVHYPAIEEFIKGPEEIGWENFNIKCRVPIMPK